MRERKVDGFLRSGRTKGRLHVCWVLAACGGRTELDASIAVDGSTRGLINGSFELGGMPCDDFGIPKGSTAIPGWTVLAENIDWVGAPPPRCGWQASDGTNSIDLVGDKGIGGIEQTFATTPGTTYAVAFDLAGNFDAPPAIKPVVVTVDGVTMTYTFDTKGRSFFDMGWTTKRFSFVASGTSATIRFTSDVRGSSSLNAGAAIDNVRVTP